MELAPLGGVECPSPLLLLVVKVEKKLSSGGKLLRSWTRKGLVRLELFIVWSLV